MKKMLRFKKNYNNSIKSFSIIELSISLAMITTLVAAVSVYSKMSVLGGVRAAIRDISFYKSAADNFKYIYSQYPGDFSNANSLWGITNGNGNGNIDSGYTEDMYAWQHLQSAGYIPGSYPGTAPTSYPVIGTNIPSGTIANSAYYLSSFYVYSIIGNGLILFDPTSMTSATTPSTTTNGTVNGIIAAANAYYIDNKIDDGIPNKGNVFTSVGNGYTLGTNCVSSGTPYYTYNNSDIKTSCVMWFFLF